MDISTSGKDITALTPREIWDAAYRQGYRDACNILPINKRIEELEDEKDRAVDEGESKESLRSIGSMIDRELADIDQLTTKHPYNPIDDGAADNQSQDSTRG